jgi:hypothetical protein
MNVFAQQPDTINVYLVKENWHTGIMFQVNEFTRSELPLLNLFSQYEYVDIGWGDADFYQAPGMDKYLAAKAILIPTPTVIRIDGYKFPMERIIQWREFVIKFEFSVEEFRRLIKYIDDHIVYNEAGEPVITKHEPGSPIYYFKSLGEYHMFRTCNTWAAQAINSTGIDVNTFGLVTASQVYYKYAEYGKILKRFE